MAVPVPFGQYAPGDSLVHRLDARVKIGLAFAFTVALFAVSSWWGLAAETVLAVAAIAASGVPFRIALRGVAPIAWLLGFTIAMNALFPAVRSDALVQLGILQVDRVGLVTGLFFAARIILLVLGTSLLTLTTSPVALTDALATLMRPLAMVRVPVDDAAMMISIALRFMPTTAEETEKIVVAQTARGARFSAGGPIKRARAWMPVLVPLFVRLFRRADDLAVAMDARCYRGEGRTRLRESVMTPIDWTTLAIGAAAVLTVGVVL